MDEFSRYTRVIFLRRKSDASEEIIAFIKKMEILNDVRVKELRSDNEILLKNQVQQTFCDDEEISYNFSSAWTPEQNDVVERRNITLVEAVRTMLNGARVPSQFWAKLLSTIALFNPSLLNFTPRKHVKLWREEN